MLVLIDEEIGRLKTTKEYLEEEGYTASLIGSIDEARVHLKAHLREIDAIVLDLMMPWGKQYTAEETNSGITTGYSFYKELRGPLGYEGPVIIYTAAHRPELFNKLSKESLCTVLHKPDSPSRIVNELDKYGVRKR